MKFNNDEKKKEEEKKKGGKGRVNKRRVKFRSLDARESNETGSLIDRLVGIYRVYIFLTKVLAIDR